MRFPGRTQEAEMFVTREGSTEIIKFECKRLKYRRLRNCFSVNNKRTSWRESSWFRDAEFPMIAPPAREDKEKVR